MKTSARNIDREKKRAAKAAAMKRPGMRSKYARKCSGDLPPQSPYRDRWSDFAPLGSIPGWVSNLKRRNAEARARSTGRQDAA